MSVPEELLADLQAARPKCKFYLQGKCKKNYCKLVHGNNYPPSAKVPHASLHMSSDGKEYLHLRTPLPKAFGAYLGEPDILGPSRMVRHDGMDLVVFQLVGMQPPNKGKCSATKITRTSLGQKRTGAKWENVKEIKFHESQSQMMVYPDIMAHGTSYQNGLEICKSRKVFPSEGIAGEGVYGFGDKLVDGALTDEQMFQLWERTRTGGYNKGAVVFFHCLKGILVKGEAAMIVPPACVAFKKDQYAANNTVMEYDSIVFELDGLVAALGQQLEKEGYSQQLHNALRAIQLHMRTAITTPKMIKLENKVVADGHHEQKKFGAKRGERGGRDQYAPSKRSRLPSPSIAEQLEIGLIPKPMMYPQSPHMEEVHYQIIS